MLVEDSESDQARTPSKDGTLVIRQVGGSSITCSFSVEFQQIGTVFTDVTEKVSMHLVGRPEIPNVLFSSKNLTVAGKLTAGK